MVIYMWIGSYKWVNEKRETETHRTDATTTKKKEGDLSVYIEFSNCIIKGEWV
jgi:hypothetical protein